MLCFNPRTREGCDQRQLSTHRKLQVSIHAPVKGATLKVTCAISSDACFNPRTREGCDPALRSRWRSSAGFNPRTREGCDRAFQTNMRSVERFNPRTREGCDHAGGHDAGVGHVSIHAPVKGATACAAKYGHQEAVSIHAPVKGATFSPTRFMTLGSRFQSTHP